MVSETLDVQQSRQDHHKENWLPEGEGSVPITGDGVPIVLAIMLL